MYAYGDSSSFEGSARIEADEGRLFYPSPLALAAGPAYHAEEFAVELREHDAIFERSSGKLLEQLEEEADALRRVLRCEVGEMGAMALDVSIHDSAGMVVSDLRRDRATVTERAQLLHALPRYPGIQRRLVLDPRGVKMYVAIATPGAVSLRKARLRHGASAGRGVGRSPSLVAGRLLVVEPTRSKTHRVGPLSLRCARTPGHFLRMDVALRPSLPMAADVEMDRLVDLYRSELWTQWRRLRREGLATVSSTRACGDHAIVASKRHPMWPVALARYANVRRILSQRPVAGWLPVVVRTDSHVGLRWLDVGGSGSARPGDWPAETVPWKRVRRAPHLDA